MTDPKSSEPSGPSGGSFVSAENWRVELWPNRSLSRKGLRGFLIFLAACFGVFFLMTAAAPGSSVAPAGLAKVLVVILAFIVLVFACVVWAFARNNRDGRYVERIGFAGDRLVIEADHPARPTLRWEFQPYWTRVLTRTTRRVENQLILRQQDRAVAIGGFLTPDERADLADEIKRALRHFNGARA